MKSQINITALACLFIGIFAQAALTADVSWKGFQQAGPTTVLNFPDKTPRSSSSYSFSITNDSFVIQKKGRGAFHVFQEVDWFVEATGRLSSKQFLEDTSRCTIHDLSGRLLYEAQKNFDHEKRKITITINDHRNTESIRTKKYTFPMKGLTVDDIAMISFVKSFIPSADPAKVPFFYLITFEPALYKVLVKPQGQENLTLADGRRYDCIKIRLIADIGILDNVFDRYVPATFVWYERTYPYRWIQYQGLEAGRHSANIFSYIEN